MRCINFVVVVFFVIFFSNFVCALSVSPPVHEINFRPGLTRSVEFHFNSPKGVGIELSVEGELAEYVKLDREVIPEDGNVRATLTLPENIGDPGKHGIYIVGREVPSDSSGFLIVPSVKGLIAVFVPYPGKYAEAEFSAGDANAGDEVEFDVKIYSRGDDLIVTDSKIEIYSSGEFEVETEKVGFSPLLSPVDITEGDVLVETLKVGSDVIESGDFAERRVSLDTSDYAPGNYKAVLVVAHDRRVVETGAEFRLGDLFVDISDYSVELERDKIDTVVVEVQSFWNNNVKNVYVTGEVLGTDAYFETPSENLRAWSKEKLVGHVDTSLIDDDEFEVKLTVYYGNKKTERTVDMYFVSSVNYLFIGLIVLLVLAACFFAWVVWDYSRLRRKNGRKAK